MAQRGLTVKPPKVAAVAVAALLRLVEGLAGQGRAGSPEPWALRRSPPLLCNLLPRTARPGSGLLRSGQPCTGRPRLSHGPCWTGPPGLPAQLPPLWPFRPSFVHYALSERQLCASLSRGSPSSREVWEARPGFGSGRMEGWKPASTEHTGVCPHTEPCG